MAKAIRISRTGGPEVLEYVDVEVGEPGPGEARVRNHAIGMNFIDVYFRTGLYPPPLPSGLGHEAAGVVEAVGEGVHAREAGRPRGLRGAPERRLRRAAHHAGRHPRQACRTRSISRPGAAMMLQGLTVQYLFRQTYKLKAGDTILFHAAAGGVGLIACQWARAMGVNLIGTVGSDEKGGAGESHGAAHVINYNTEDVVAAGARDHRRREGAGGLRFGRQGHLHRVARLPAAARADGQLRQRVRRRCRRSH